MPAAPEVNIDAFTLHGATHSASLVECLVLAQMQSDLAAMSRKRPAATSGST
jgi:hypothetical protein